MSPNTWDTSTALNDSAISNDIDFQPAGSGGELIESLDEGSIRLESIATPSMPDLKAESSYSKVRFGNPVNETGVPRYPLLGTKNSVREEPIDFRPTDPNDRVKQYVLPEVSDLAPRTTLTPPGEHRGSGFDAVDDWYGPASPSRVPLEGLESASSKPAQPPGSKRATGFGGELNQPTNPFPGQSPYLEQHDRYVLGHRGPDPTHRSIGSGDSGKKYGFEEKGKSSPSFRETMATGRYFASASALYLKPAFQANTAITTTGMGTGASTPFDFDYESAPMIRFGFESKPGPGIELNYWRYDETSNVSSFTSSGSVSGEVSTWMLGPSRWSRLSAVNAGESLMAAHTIDVDSIGATFFKEVQLPISRFTGKFGFQWVNATQTMNATLSNGGGTLGQLNTRSDLRAFGPSCAFEYYRPIGHTRLEIVSSVGGSLLFGHRDQMVQNTLVGDFNQIDADEFLTTADLLMGVQYMKWVAEKRGYYVRLGLTYQTWMGGGTAVDSEGDFGLHGFSFSLGYNR